MQLAAGILAIVLCYWAGASDAGDRKSALWSAILFMTMPVFLTAMGEGAPLLMPLVFVTAWLACMRKWRHFREQRWLVSAGAALGLGLYTHYAAMAIMPLFFAQGLVALLADGAPVRSLAGLSAGFAVTAIPLSGYLIVHPEYVQQHVAALGLYDTQRFNILQGIKDMTSWVGLTARSEAYWHYLDPAFLFLSGGNVIDSAFNPKIFLLPLAVLLPAGAFTIMSRWSPYTAWLLIGGFLIAPVAWAIAVKAPSGSCVLIGAPFAAIISAAAIPEVVAFPSRLLAEYQRRRLAINAGNRGRH